MTQDRAIPGHMCMAEAVPFGQRFTYHTEHGLDAVLAPGYFLTVRSYFETGDEVRVVRIADGRVDAIVDLMAVEVRPDHLELRQLGPVIDVGAPYVTAPTKKPTAKRRTAKKPDGAPSSP